MVLTVVLLVLVAVLAATVAALWATRRVPESADAEREAVVAAAVDAVLSQGAHVLAMERSQTIEAAVSTVSQVAAGQLDVRSASFDERVRHVTDELTGLRHLVGELQTDRASQTASLAAQLESMASGQRRLSDHTEALRAALANPKQRGQWGERMAEDVLRAAGMRDGVQYLRQRALPDGGIPDFRFLLPGDLEVRMDVKFPADNYLRTLEADTDEDRAKYTKAFVRDVRNRIGELKTRGYIDARDTVDCMLLFIPNEAVYAFLHEADPDVIDVALAHKVVLCSPATLFGVLAVIRHSVEQFRLERTSDEILRCLSGVTDEWKRFAESLDKVGRQLDTVHRSFNDDLAGTRRRVFERSLNQVDSLREADADAATGVGEALVARKARGDVRPLPAGEAGVRSEGRLPGVG